jgi:hypothetical protein
MNEDEAKGLARDIETLRNLVRWGWEERIWIVWLFGSLMLLGRRLRLWAEGWR